MVVLITAGFHFVLAFWFLYMAIYRYRLYPDPGWFPNSEYCASFLPPACPFYFKRPISSEFFAPIRRMNSCRHQLCSREIISILSNLWRDLNVSLFDIFLWDIFHQVTKSFGLISTVNS